MQVLSALLAVILLFGLVMWIEHFNSDLWPPED